MIQTVVIFSSENMEKEEELTIISLCHQEVSSLGEMGKIPSIFDNNL
jgi:hypothetical protein